MDIYYHKHGIGCIAVHFFVTRTMINKMVELTLVMKNLERKKEELNSNIRKQI